MFNAQGTYEVNTRVGVRLQVFNILNTRAPDITCCYTSRLPGEPAAGVADLHFHPVESRSFRIGLVGTF